MLLIKIIWVSVAVFILGYAVTMGYRDIGDQSEIVRNPVSNILLHIIGLSSFPVIIWIWISNGFKYALIAFIIGCIIMAISKSITGKSIGPRYKKYLQETQRSLLLNKFPQLTDGDLYDIQTTRACDLARYILQQEYYQLYIQKHYLVLEKLMDKGMELGGPYRAITLWLNGEMTKQEAIDFLRDIDSDPDYYRLIFNTELQKY